MKIFTSSQMKLAERLTAETAGISTLKLMENAGERAAEVIKQEFDVRNKLCVAICGNGGNGGDGFATLLKLAEMGAEVIAVLACGKPKTEDAKEMYRAFCETGASVVSWESDPPSVSSVIASADLLIDALFGIGFHGELYGAAADIIDCINHAEAFTVSLDIPSGADADSGRVCSPCVHADVTVAFSLPKFAHFQLSSALACGKIYIADISVPKKIIAGIESDFELIDNELVRVSLPRRSLDAHKGDCGRTLLICGSYAMPGAAVMSTLASVKSGVGLAVLAIPESAYPLVAGRINEPVYLPLPCKGKELDSASSLPLLIPEIEKADSIVIGCGFTDNDALLPILEAVLRYAKCPVIIDADGINLISRNIELLENTSAEVVLTPHLGEMSRLCKRDIPEIREDRIKTALDFAVKYKVTLALKGARTIVACPDGKVYCNLNGNPGMAVGGSGDVLAGIVGSLCAQGIPSPLATACGVYIHGEAGDLCESAFTQFCMTPTDIISALPQVFKNILTKE